MKVRTLLAAFLLAAGFCLMSSVGYSNILGKYEFQEWKEEFTGDKEVAMEVMLLEVRIDYIMRNPTSFLDVEFYYDPIGMYGALLPGDIDTKKKIWVDVLDNRSIFFDKSGVALLDEVKKQLAAIFSLLFQVTMDIDNDVVVSVGVIPPGSKIRTHLAYFYQGEYHLREEQPQKEQPQTEKVVYITETGKKYHGSGCRYLDKGCIPISLAEAKRQDYTPCKVCNPP